MELEANEWNSTAPFMIQSDGGPDFKITKSQINQTAVGAYPALFVGRHGNFVTQNDPFPLQLSSIASGQVSTDVSSVTPSSASSAKWQDFYDIFLTASPNANQFSSTREELEIWQNAANRGPNPKALVAKGVSLDGHLYNVYDSIPSQDTVAYVPQTYNDKFSGDLLPFIKDSINRGYAQSSWYLTDIEHGFEVSSGNVVGLGDSSFGVKVRSTVIGASPSSSTVAGRGG